MGAKEFIKSFFKKYTEQDVPIELDLWPAIISRFQNSGEEVSNVSSGADHDGSPKSLMARLPEVLRKSNNLISPKHKEFAMEKEKQGGGGPLTRRDFLKVSGATAAAAAVVGGTRRPVLRSLEEISSNAKSAQMEEQIYAGACRGNCASGCFVNIHVRDGKVVQISMRDMPDPQYNRICVKGLTQMQRIYHPDRLKYPMKRVGERGEGKFERITWDEAITTITDKWKSYTKEFGKESFAISWGSGSYGALSGQAFGCPTNRLLNVAGCAYIPMTVDAAHGHVAGYAVGWGLYFTHNEPKDLKNAKTILIWGSNPVISQPHVMHFIMEAREQGTKVIVIDPIQNITASKADDFVPIRPGTDGALALAMMNIVVREGWIDTTFLKKATVAPFLVKETDGKYLRLSDTKTLAQGDTDQFYVSDKDGNIGLVADIADPVIEGSFEYNGVKVNTAYSLLLKHIADYTPKKAADICNIPVEKIEELARIYATNTPSTIYMYFGIDHYINGHYNIFPIYALAMITGNMAKPGAACGMGEVLPFFINFAGTGYPKGATGPAINLPLPEMNTVMDEHKSGTKDITLKGAYFTHINHLSNAAQRQGTIDWMKKLDFVAVADMNMNETARYADILLPVAHWFEVKDLFACFGTHPYMLLQEKAVEPPYECKSDFEITKLIAEKMGWGEQFQFTEEEYMDLWLDTDFARSMNLTRENIEKEKALKCLPGDNFVFAEGGVFGTPTGRAQFYNETPAPGSNYDARFWNKKMDVELERWPTWVKPYEAWHENPLHDKYPYILISEHVKFRTHSQWWDVPTLLELDPEPIVKFNSVDAAKYRIRKGDKVKLFNDRGSVVMTAAIHQGVQPGVLLAPKGWEKQQFIDGHFSDLTNHDMNPVCANSGFFDVLVGVEKL
jgi:molybdopterin-containing oxidoreductase family molybdopterin binding subunit